MKNYSLIVMHQLSRDDLYLEPLGAGDGEYRPQFSDL
jgi:hypothetical protein